MQSLSLLCDLQHIVTLSPPCFSLITSPIKLNWTRDQCPSNTALSLLISYEYHMSSVVIRARPNPFELPLAAFSKRVLVLSKDGPIRLFRIDTIPSTIFNFFFDIDTDTVRSLKYIVSHVIWLTKLRLSRTVFCSVLYNSINKTVKQVKNFNLLGLIFDFLEEMKNTAVVQSFYLLY